MTPSLRRLTWRLWALVVSANFMVTLAFYVGLLSWHNAYFPNISVWNFFRYASWIGTLYFTAATLHAYTRVRRIIRPAVQWMFNDQPSTPEARLALAGAPRRIALWSGFYWFLAPFWGIPVFTRLPDYNDMPIFLIVKILVAWIALGFAATMLAYLLAERGLRHVRAAAFLGETMLAGYPTMGMFTKLILAWAGAALLPMGAMMLFLVGTTSDQRLRSAPVIWTTGSVGLIAGIAVTIYAARAIVDPINGVRRGLRRIGEGQLDTIDVGEAGELGLLQAGVNQMVTGLRERDRMRELFGHHVGDEVAQRALGGTISLGGESREATALFVDIISSTSLAQQRSPAEVVVTLNEFFDAVVRCVGAEGGFVNKFEGDGALCIFGAPVDQPDHATRALRAARALRKELDHMAESLDAAIGVSSGEVVAGNVGAANRYEYTVIGDPVNEADRLTEEAKSRRARVLVSDSTFRNASDEWEHWTQAGTVLLRGRSSPTIAFEPS